MLNVWVSGLWNTTRKLVRDYPGATTCVFVLLGILAWGAFNWSLELANTERFCISCHVMKDNVYAEYKETIHYRNRTGVRATCPDCHVPKTWIHKLVRKVGATNELFHWFAGSIDTREKFAAKRLQLARYVWDGMERTDSRECRNCHDKAFMDRQAQTTYARVFHGLGDSWNLTCINCHKGIAHKLPKEFDRVDMMDDLHDRMADRKVNCRQCHVDMAAPPPGEEWR